MDVRLKPKVVDTAVAVVETTWDSTLLHDRNKLSVGTQSVDRSDVIVHS